MSYRTRVNDMQIFGNNESHPEWDKYIQSQGIEIGPEGQYDGEIRDFHEALVACEDIAKRLMKERQEEDKSLAAHLEKALARDPGNEHAAKRLEQLHRSYFDLSGYQKWLDDGTQSLFDINWEIATSAYAFLPFTLYMACRDLVEQCGPEENTEGLYRIRKFRFKDGASAHVHAG